MRSSRGKYLFVYPFWKQREWYRLPGEERMRIMREHIEIGRRYPGVSINTTYSFGLDDQEFVRRLRDRRARRLPRPRAGAAGQRVERLHAARHADLHLHRVSVRRALDALDGGAQASADLLQQAQRGRAGGETVIRSG